MPMIAVLPPALASQIAAGEVVERPSSAIKELVENAIDAGATRCDVAIEGGGITRLEVRDDGSGMSPEDAMLSLQRHATSKLSRLEQLQDVVTMGFRGEALPSIASVSRFRLRTRRPEDDSGTEVGVEGDRTLEPRPVGMPPGTVVEARDLFFNVPARRKFLRSSGTESGHITDVLEAAALARPDMSFTLTRDGRSAREWLRAGNRAERVRGVLGAEELATCRGERGPLRVEAFLGRPERARNGAGGLRLLLNGRPIRDRSLLHTIAQAYGSTLERGRYPRGVVYLELPVRLVDVNAHPQKTEVRFADPRAMSDALYAILSKQLREELSLPAEARTQWTRPAEARQQWPRPAEARPPWTRSAASVDAPRARAVADAETPEPEEKPRPYASPTAPRVATPAGSDVSDSHVVRGDPWNLAPMGTDAPATSGDSPPWARLRFVAQVRQTYLVCEGPEGIYVVDQHAASERVNFGRLRAEYASTAVPSQALLFPQTIDCTPAEAEMAERFAKEFKSVGLEVARRGESAISVHSVPRLLQRASPERMVRDLIAELSRGGRAFEELVDLALARMACHGSIRAGDALGQQEAQALLEGLASTSFEGHCPHGRPVVAVTTWAELERRVGRR